MKLSHQIYVKQVQTLKQILSPKVLQMMRTFQASYTDLLNDIQQEANDNVFLEISQYDQLSNTIGKSTSISSSSDGSDISDYLSDKQAGSTLIDHIETQIALEYLGEKEIAIAHDLINELDERGWIEHYHDIKARLCKKHSISERKLHDVLKIIQSLEPEGIGARSLKECLLIQLDHQTLENEELNDVIKHIITHHLDDLAEHRYDAIAETLDIDPDGVDAVHEFIRQNFNPNPGKNFGHSQINNHIVPSFEVTYIDDTLHYKNLEADLGIKISVSSQYTTLLNDPNLDKDSETFLKEKLKKAQEMVDNINKRHENLDRLAKYIIDKQHAFFTKGRIYLEPLLQKDIAKDLNITPSTVSRMTSSKYIITPHGTFALKHLCPRNHFGKTAERLTLIVHDITKKNPSWSDQKISDFLKKEGMNIARRTVTKYRHKIV